MGAKKVTAPAYVPPGASKERIVPGMEPASATSNSAKNKQRNAAKKEKARLKKEQEAKEAEEKLRREAEELAKRQEEERDLAAKAAADPEKRVKKINKLLKQIDALKEKDADSLDDDQKRKIETEQDLRAELNELESKLA